MASSGSEEARVPIAIPVQTNAGEAADSVDQLSEAISKSKDAIALAAQNMRNLRGKTDAVKAAKDQLKASIRAEEDAVTKATLKLLKQGTSYDRVAQQAKKLAKEQEGLKKKQDALAKIAAKKKEDAIKKQDADRANAFANAISRAGGPVARLREQMKGLSEIASQGGGLGVVTLAAAGATVAVLALTAAVVAGVAAVARWAIKGADTARSMQLVREAATGSSLSARNLGTHVDALASKVPTATEDLNKLAASLARSRLGGQTTVDTLNAVAQASAAIDEGAGSKIRGIIERGKLAQRMYLGLRELEGTGLDFTDVASSLAKNMHISVKDAQAALLSGRVKLADGAKAMRDAVEAKFGGINLRKMMSLEGLTDTLQKKFASMTSGINLEPASRAIYKLLQVFDETTATGAVLKRVVTVFGDGIVKAIERGAPIAKDFIRSLIIGGLKVYITYLEVKKAFKEAFGKDVIGDFDAVGVAFKTLSFWANNAKTIITTWGGVMVWVVTKAIGVAVAVNKYFISPIREAKAWIDSIDWAATGKNIIDGIIGGLTGSASALVDKIKGLGDMMSKAFTGKLEIRSPSGLFRRHTKQVPAGAAKGIDDGAPDVRRAVEKMAPAPSDMATGGAGARLGGGNVTIHVEATIVLQGGGASSPSEQVNDPGLLEQLTKVFRQAAGAAGLSVAEGT